MALVTCPDCSNPYDETANHCPNCGHPNPLKQPGGGGPGRFEAPRPGEPPRPGAGGQAGGPSYGQGGGPSMGAGGAGYAGPRPEVPNYLVFAIFLTLCCCPPFAVPALINAARVDARRDLGDYEGAMTASREAKKWCFIALGVGLVLWTLFGVGYGAFIAAAMRMAEQQGMTPPAGGM
jgi:hypothetical protein